jgi:hypothetical protein
MSGQDTEADSRLDSERPPTPPALWEIFLLPAAGAAIIEAIHTKQNEVALLLLPFLIAVFRLFLAQFGLPPKSPDARRQRAARNSVAINQLAVFVLIFFEFLVVMAANPTVPVGLWFFIVPFFALYVALRLWSRSYWKAAAGLA